MGRFDEHFDRDTKAAVAKYGADRKDEGERGYLKAAHEALRDGDIPGIPAQTMSRAYVGDLVRKEIQRRRGHQLSAVAKLEPSEAKENLRKRVVSLIDNAVRDYEDGKVAISPEDGLKLIRMWRELDAMGNGAEPRKHRARPTQSDKPPAKETSTTLTRMVRAHHDNELGHTEQPVAA